MLIYRKYDSIEVIGYSGFIFVKRADTRKSTFCYAFLLEGGAIWWTNVK